ncbi:N-6 DNA methylase [Candidatus Poribacteria bacterium]|nr:N-6 DNA methylase [Candidatus Poribacteria bacterium]
MRGKLGQESIIKKSIEWRKKLIEKTEFADSNFEIKKVIQASQKMLLRLLTQELLKSRKLHITDTLNKLIRPDISFYFPKKIVDEIKDEISSIRMESIPFEILGNVYENFLVNRIIYDEKYRKINNEKSNKYCKGKGIYYTPQHIIQYIVDQTLGKYLWGKKKHISSSRDLESIKDLKICDPACGSGYFLTYAFNLFVEFYSYYYRDDDSWVSDIVNNHLFGMDLDQEAIEIASAIIILKSIVITRKDIVFNCKNNISNENYLLPKRCHNNSDLDKKYQIIIGNPPYGIKFSKNEKMLLQDEFGCKCKLDSTSLFIRKSIKSLETDGLLGFIVPKSLSYVLSWENTRQLLLDKCKILEIIDTRKVFPNVRLEQLIIIASKTEKKQQIPISISVAEKEKINYSHRINNKYLRPKRFYIWVRNENVKNIINKLTDNCISLGDITQIWSGLNPNSHLYPENEEKDTVLKGRDIKRYKLKKDVPQRKKNERAFINGLKRFYNPKIVTQDIVAHIKHPKPHIKLMAALDEEGYWLNSNTVTNIVSDSYPLSYLCAIINSRFISWYVHQFIYNQSTRTMHFRKGYADDVPVPIISDINQALVTKIVNAVKEIVTCNDKGNFIFLDSYIDRLVFNLYNLNDKDRIFLKEVGL